MIAPFGFGSRPCSRSPLLLPPPPPLPPCLVTPDRNGALPERSILVPLPFSISFSFTPDKTAWDLSRGQARERPARSVRASHVTRVTCPSFFSARAFWNRRGEGRARRAARRKRASSGLIFGQDVAFSHSADQTHPGSDFLLLDRTDPSNSQPSQPCQPSQRAKLIPQMACADCPSLQAG